MTLHRLLAIIVVLSGSRIAFAAPTTLDFEDLPSGTLVTTDYVRLGFVFPDGVTIAVSPSPHSGRQLVHQFQPEFAAHPMAVEFKGGQASVSLFAGTQEPSAVNPTGTLRALNASGAVVAVDGPKPVIASACATPFHVTSASSEIARVELTILVDTTGGRNLSDIAMDDLVIDGAPPPPITSSAPSIVFLAPSTGQTVDVATMLFHATVTGAGLPPTASLSLTVAQEPGKPTVPGLGATVPLTVTGNTADLTFARALPLGLYTVRIDVTNLDGLKGTASETFTNLPAVIGSRYRLEGGAAVLGVLSFTIAGRRCAIAIFDRGAIAQVTGGTLAILAPIFPVWRRWISARYNDYVLGAKDDICPTEEQRASRGDAVAQSFVNGRIFASPSLGSHFVPGVFASAIDQLGGEAATGIPVGDPQRALATKTWIFQQFRRPDAPAGTLDSTLEIKGSTPALFVERLGGDLSGLPGGARSLSVTTPTIVEQYACSGSQGPCSIPPTPPAPSVVDAPGVCKGVYGVTPEWVAVSGDYHISTYSGIVVSQDLSSQDDGFTHECSNDFEITVLPRPASRALLGTGNPNQLRLEVENCWVEYPLLKLNAYPQVGDLLTAGGRHIADCGHPPAQTEIHPPFFISFARTSGLRTTAQILVNGYFTGEPFSIDVFPPPRPSPIYDLILEKTRDSDAALDVKVAVKALPEDAVPAFVRAKFSSSSIRRGTVSPDSGQMYFQKGRAYAGSWSLLWQPANAGYSVQSAGPDWWP